MLSVAFGTNADHLWANWTYTFRDITTNERTNERTNKQTRPITIPPGVGNYVTLR